MWHTITLANYVSSQLIDNSSVRFNLSAWLGGLDIQDDSAAVTLTFINTNTQIVGNISSMLFQQVNGTVPINARILTILATMTRSSGANNNGVIDNIAVTLYP
jgi:hypothetical protein